MTTKATAADLKEALQSDTASVILYSSHGNEERFIDFNHLAIPNDIFTNKAPNVYQFILSACKGRRALHANYYIPSDLVPLAWTENTTTTELFEYLRGDSWTGFEGKK
jgi:hypothetical protein